MEALSHFLILVLETMFAIGIVGSAVLTVVTLYRYIRGIRNAEATPDPH